MGFVHVLGEEFGNRSKREMGMKRWNGFGEGVARERGPGTDRLKPQTRWMVSKGRQTEEAAVGFTVKEA